MHLCKFFVIPNEKISWLVHISLPQPENVPENVPEDSWFEKVALFQMERLYESAFTWSFQLIHNFRMYFYQFLSLFRTFMNCVQNLGIYNNLYWAYLVSFLSFQLRGPLDDILYIQNVHLNYFVIVEDVLWPLVGNRIKIQGFNVMQFTSDYPVACKHLVQWIKEVRVVIE